MTPVDKVRFDGHLVLRPITKIAVLVPAYNVEKYLGACLDSLHAQTRPVDVFCCDDGSTDGTLAVLEASAAKSPRIHFVTQPNAGVCAARNRLLDELPPEYDAIGFVDGDDLVHPEMYAALAEAMEKNNADMAECTYVRVPHDATAPALVDAADRRDKNPVDAMSSSRPTSPRVLDDLSCYFLKSTSPGQWINAVTKLMRRSAVGSIRFRTALAHEDDYYYSFEVHQAIRRKMLLSDAYYSYRMNPASATHRLNFRKWVTSCCERIRLSQVEFLNAGRIPTALVPAFRKELAHDAYRMCIRKNLEKNKNAAERRELFVYASDFLRTLERDAGFKPVGLNPVQRLVYKACIKRHCLVARSLIGLT